jgi:hypothetical protein
VSHYRLPPNDRHEPMKLGAVRMDDLCALAAAAGRRRRHRSSRPVAGRDRMAVFFIGRRPRSIEDLGAFLEKERAI